MISCCPRENQGIAPIPRLGQSVGNVIVGKKLARFDHLSSSLSLLPTDILSLIYRYLSARDLAVMERVSRIQHRQVKTIGWEIYFKKRGFKCWNKATKQQWMTIPLLFGPKQLIVHIGLDRWLGMIQRNTLAAEMIKQDDSLIDIKKMGNRTFAFWVNDNRAYFAIRYIKVTNETREQNIVVFCQNSINARNWTVRGSDDYGLCTLFTGSVNLYEWDDWRWNYFSRLIRGEECGTGPKGQMCGEKIILWNPPAN